MRDGAGEVADNVVRKRREIHMARVGAGGLQSVEQQAGHLTVNFAGEQGGDDLHERVLDGIDIFQNGQIGATAADADAAVEVAEAAAFECGRAALHAIDADVMATRDVGGTSVIDDGFG